MSYDYDQAVRNLVNAMKAKAIPLAASSDDESSKVSLSSTSSGSRARRKNPFMAPTKFVSPTSVTKLDLLSHMSQQANTPRDAEDSSSLSSAEGPSHNMASLMKAHSGSQIVTSGAPSVEQEPSKHSGKLKRPGFFWSKPRNNPSAILKPISEDGQASLSASTNDFLGSSSAATGDEASCFTSEEERGVLYAASLAEVFDASSLSSFDEESISSREKPIVGGVEKDLAVSSLPSFEEPSVSSKERVNCAKVEEPTVVMSVSAHTTEAASSDASLARMEAASPGGRLKEFNRTDEQSDGILLETPNTDRKRQCRRSCLKVLVLLFLVLIVTGTGLGLSLRYASLSETKAAEATTSAASNKTASPTSMQTASPTSKQTVTPSVSPSTSAEPTQETAYARTPVSVRLVFSQPIEDFIALADVIGAYLTESLMTMGKHFLFVELHALETEDSMNRTVVTRRLQETKVTLVGSVVFDGSVDAVVVASMAERVCGFLKDVGLVQQFLSQVPAFGNLVYEGPDRHTCEPNNWMLGLNVTTSPSAAPTSEVSLTDELDPSPAAPPSTEETSDIAPNSPAAILYDMTSIPTIMASVAPSYYPSGGPSATPTDLPSGGPSAAPSTSPSDGPSTLPTEWLSEGPSLTPTKSYSSAPTIRPSQNAQSQGSQPALPSPLQLKLYLGTSPENVRWHFQQLNADGTPMSSGSCLGCYTSQVYVDQTVTENLKFRLGPDGSAELKISVFDETPQCDDSTGSDCARGYGKYEISYGDNAWGDEFQVQSVQKETSFRIKLNADGSAMVEQSEPSQSKNALPRPIFDLEEMPERGPFVEVTFSFDTMFPGNIGWALSHLNSDGGSSIVFEHPVGTYSDPAFRYETLKIYLPIYLVPENVDRFHFRVEDVSTEPDCCWGFSWQYVDENNRVHFGSRILDQGKVVPMVITDRFSVMSDGVLDAVSELKTIPGSF